MEYRTQQGLFAVEGRGSEGGEGGSRRVGRPREGETEHMTVTVFPIKYFDSNRGMRPAGGERGGLRFILNHQLP